MTSTMPSETEERYHICVVGGEIALQTKMRLPEIMADVEKLHAYWSEGPEKGISMHNPKIGSMNSGLLNLSLI